MCFPLSQIKNTPAAKVAFMAFSTAPAKAARAQAAAARRLKEVEEGEEEEEEVGGVTHCQRSHSTSTQSTVVEIHPVEDEDAGQRSPCAQQPSIGLRSKGRPPIVSKRLSYTSLWPTAKDVVITSSTQSGTLPPVSDA